VGYQFPNNQDLKFTNNVVWQGGWETKGWQRAVVTGNRWQAQYAEMNVVYPRNGFRSSDYNWNRNEYHYLGTSNPFNIGSVIGGDFAFWTTKTGFDEDSTFSKTRARGVTVYMRPNSYDSNRVNTIIYNWDGRNVVKVDVSRFLSPGTRYELRNAQDYFGPPVLTGTYQGQPLEVPMSGLKVAPPVGGSAPERRTWPNFNVFVLIKR